MPRYNFQVAIRGHIDSRTVDDALFLLEEFVQEGQAHVEYIDASVGGVTRSTFVQGRDDPAQLSLFTQPRLVQ